MWDHEPGTSAEGGQPPGHYRGVGMILLILIIIAVFTGYLALRRRGRR